MTYPFQIVDVFGRAGLAGNPVAIVFDAPDVPVERMQRLATWLNLSETVFLSAPTEPGADYRARIFSLDRELPFAGHPTLGACHAWLSAGGKPAAGDRVIQQCGVGLITVRRGDSGNAFAAPPLVRGGPVSAGDLAEVLAVLGLAQTDVIEARWVDNGPGWVAVLLASAEAVLEVEPARYHSKPVTIGLVGPHAPGAGPAYEVRAFFSDGYGAIREDPVCGSLNASVAQWMVSSDRARAPYHAGQGARVGSDGRIDISCDAEGQVWVGGAARVLVSGVIDLA